MTLPKRKGGEKNEKNEPKQGNIEMLVGVLAVAQRLKCSMRTVSRYKAEYRDFPVVTEPKTGIWNANAEEIDSWREKHIDLFVSRKERLDQKNEPLFKKFPSRW